MYIYKTYIYIYIYISLKLQNLDSEYDIYEIQNIFQLPERKVESKTPCLIYRTNMVNVGFT